MADPTIEIVRFHRDHNPARGPYSGGTIRKGKDELTKGFVRGQNLAVGQIVRVQSTDGKKEWAGVITAWGGNDDYGSNAWYFCVVNIRDDENDPSQGDGTITVTVTNPPPSPPALTPNPQPVVSP